MLFLGIYVLKINTLTALLAEWLVSSRTVGVDISHRIFNVDCRVGTTLDFSVLYISDSFDRSTRSTPQNGQFLYLKQLLVYVNSGPG